MEKLSFCSANYDSEESVIACEKRTHDLKMNTVTTMNYIGIGF